MSNSSVLESDKNLFKAIDENDTTKMKNVLVEKTNVNILDETLMTPLQHASYKGNKDMVQMLLDHVSFYNIQFITHFGR